MKNLSVYILFFLIAYLTFLFAVEPFVVKQGLKTIRKILVVVGFSIIPFVIMLLFSISLIR
jgi:mannose/fructose/N-acetylgalactosamine-specific phosphotransferase system component IIC